MNNSVFKRGDVFSLTHKDILFTFIIKGREGDNIWGVIYGDKVGEEPMRSKDGFAFKIEYDDPIYIYKNKGEEFFITPAWGAVYAKDRTKNMMEVENGSITNN